MVLPLVPLALWGIGVASGATGAGLGLKGGFDIKHARSRAQRAQALYDVNRRDLESQEHATNEALQGLGAQQEKAIELVVERMADFLRRHEKQVTDSQKLLAEGLEPGPGAVDLDRRLGQDAISWVRGAVVATIAGLGTRAGLTTAVASFGTASTGTAISTLSGAAATNATLASLGGGSLAAGGGGMVAGAAALNVVTAGPALLITGLTVAKQGEKLKTRASEIEAEISIEIAAMGVTSVKFDAVVQRVDELGTLLGLLVDRATSALDLLESEPFDPERHATTFQEALILTLAVRDIASTPVVDESNNLNDNAAKLGIRYRALVKETEGG